MTYYYQVAGDGYSAREIFWSQRPSRQAWTIDEGFAFQTTVYQCPTFPFWYSIALDRAGLFGHMFFETEIAALEQLIKNLKAQIYDLHDCHLNATLRLEEAKREEQGYVGVDTGTVGAADSAG